MSASDELPIAQGVAMLDAIGFQRGRYLEQYEDLRHAGLLEADAPVHLLRYGLHEGRLITYDAPLSVALSRLRDLDITKPAETVFARVLGSSRVAEAGFDGHNPDRLADVLVPTDAFRPLVLIGDSHVRLYNEATLLTAEGGNWLPVPFTCWAGSARGLSNQASRARYGQRIRAFLERHAERLDDSCSVVFFKFGQVDLEFVYNFRRLNTGAKAFQPLDYLDFVAETARRYGDFVASVAGVLPSSVTVAVASAFPPTLSDAAVREGYVNAHVAELEDAGAADALVEGLRDLEMPEWRVRTLFHALWNHEVRRRCEATRLRFFDDFSPFVGPEGVVSRRFIAEHGGTDHHLSPNEATRAVVRSLGRNLLEIDSPARHDADSGSIG